MSLDGVTLSAREHPKPDDFSEVNDLMLLIVRQMEVSLVCLLRAHKIKRQRPPKKGPPQKRRFKHYRLVLEQGFLDLEIDSVYDYRHGAWEYATDTFIQSLENRRQPIRRN